MTTIKRYQVEQHTACDGWTNTWTEEEGGETTLQTFSSRAEAMAALTEFLEDLRVAVEAGDMAETYHRADFRVRAVRSRAGVEA
ncbi:hypothetical protein C8J36_12319 [Rhizobium sp. PP-F2F-G48]|uniref:DUF2188 domain-containing protein n=1 Tax=Rhizobium sp. PP-F2F-G48 TaxID=2135651 RepID=UPI00105386BD|nr:DUF2188 domain-containing protein [Rhizobium sp. PP-F2F-G48]TCM44847.1 hypothetical protein C8J36_12319 [Rhizobium sp. PP-F2F-G48]